MEEEDLLEPGDIMSHHFPSPHAEIHMFHQNVLTEPQTYVNVFVFRWEFLLSSSEVC